MDELGDLAFGLDDGAEDLSSLLEQLSSYSQEYRGDPATSEPCPSDLYDPVSRADDILKAHDSTPNSRRDSNPDGHSEQNEVVIPLQTEVEKKTPCTVEVDMKEIAEHASLIVGHAQSNGNIDETKIKDLFNTMGLSFSQEKVSQIANLLSESGMGKIESTSSPAPGAPSPSAMTSTPSANVPPPIFSPTAPPPPIGYRPSMMGMMPPFSAPPPQILHGHPGGVAMMNIPPPLYNLPPPPGLNESHFSSTSEVEHWHDNVRRFEEKLKQKHTLKPKSNVTSRSRSRSKTKDKKVSSRSRSRNRDHNRSPKRRRKSSSSSSSSSSRDSRRHSKSRKSKRSRSASKKSKRSRSPSKKSSRKPKEIESRKKSEEKRKEKMNIEKSKPKKEEKSKERKDEKGREEPKKYKKVEEKKVKQEKSEVDEPMIVEMKSGPIETPEMKKKKQCWIDDIAKFEAEQAGMENNMAVLSAQIEEVKRRKGENKKRSQMLEETLATLKKEHIEMTKTGKHKSKDSILKKNLSLQEAIKGQMDQTRRFTVDINKALDTGSVKQINADNSVKKLRRKVTELKQNVENLNKLTKGISEPPKKVESRKGEDNKSKTKPSVERKDSSGKESRELLPSPPIMQQKSARYQYYDAGGHWCSKCNVTTSSVLDMLEHVHCNGHRAKLDVYDRPWMDEMSCGQPCTSAAGSQMEVVPLKGVEMLIPCNAFYCRVCQFFTGDTICGEQHLKSEQHNANYRKFVAKDSTYERRLLLETAAALTSRALHNSEQESNKQSNERFAMQSIGRPGNSEDLRRVISNDQTANSRNVKSDGSSIKIQLNGAQTNKSTIKPRSRSRSPRDVHQNNLISSRRRSRSRDLPKTVAKTTKYVDPKIKEIIDKNRSRGFKPLPTKTVANNQAKSKKRKFEEKDDRSKDETKSRSGRVIDNEDGDIVIKL